MRDHYFVRNGVLFVGQDIYWHLGQVHGHDRHTWIMDDWEVGSRAAEHYTTERWVGGAARMLAYLDHMVEIDRWMASPEGEAALAKAGDEIRSRRSPKDGEAGGR